MKAVEIEFLMRDKLSEGMDKAGQSATSMGDKISAASEDIKTKIQQTRDNIQQTEEDLKKLEKQLSKTPPGNQFLELKAEVEACKKALQEEKSILNSLEGDHDKVTNSAQRLSRQLTMMQDAMARMRLEGKQLTPEYAEFERKAAELADTLADVRNQTNILSHDNSGLQGVISGASGAAGAMTALTGVMGLYAGQNEDLIKIQTRVQSVMAITMGLQQVMNTLNKDSAFRLVTVVKMKKLLTAANTKLAVSLGISTVAAKALMATLTLGLSAVITGLIVLWDKYSDAADKAAEKAKERVKIESDGRAQMIKTRFELENTIKTLKDFTGNKEEEKKKVEELNRKYGESFGYYNTVAEWYDVLIQKSNDYIQMLFLQAKAQNLVNKAVEADEKVNEIRATNQDDVDGSIGWFAKMGLYMAQSDSYGQFDAQKAINDHNKKAKEDALKAAEAERDSYLDEAKQLQEEIGKIGKEAGIGGFTAPTIKPTTQNNSLAKSANNLADLELKARQKIEDQTIALMEEGYEKQRRTAEQAFIREKERINNEEAARLALYEKLKAAGENVTEEDKQKIIAQAATLRAQAAGLYDQALADIDDKAKTDEQERIEKLLEPYKDFAQRRYDIEEKYRKDIKALQDSRTDDNSEQIDRAIEQAKRNRTREYEQLDNEISDSARKSSALLQSIFTDAGKQSKQQISEVVTEAEKLLKVLSGEASGESLGFTPEQVAAMQKDSALIQELIQAIIDKKNELYDRGGSVSKFVGSFKQIKEALSMEDAGKRMEALEKGIGNMITNGQELCSVFGGFADDLAGIAELTGSDSLGSIAESMQSVTNVAGSMMEGASAGMSIGGPWGAAIGAAISGVSSVLSMAGEASARHKAALKEIEDSKLAYQRKYNLLLLEQKLLMEEANNVFGERSIAKAANALEVYREALAEYKKELQGDAPTMSFWERMTKDASGTYAARMAEYEKGMYALSSAEIVTGHKKTGLFGWGKGKDTYSGLLEVYPELIDSSGRLDTAMASTILETRKMSDETRNLIQSLIDLQDQADAALEQLRDYLQETFGALGDGIMDSITDAIINGGNDAWETFGKTGASVLENLGKQLTYSLFFAKQFDKLQEDLEGIYGSGKSEKDIADDAMKLLGNFYNGIGSQMDAAQYFMEEWQKKAAEYGFNLWESEETTQSGKSGAYTAMTQDQGTKLEGLFTSLQIHAISIDDKLDNVGEGLYLIQETLLIIRDHVARLEVIEELMKEIKRDGLKMK